MRLKPLKRPSEYIKIGCARRPRQIFKRMFGDDGSCAFGALVEGFAGELSWNTCNEDLGRLVYEAKLAMPWLVVYVQRHCPECREFFIMRDLTSGIMHLNDTHHWSREQIGEWLDQFAVTVKSPVDGKRAEKQKTTDEDERAVLDKTPYGGKRCAETLSEKKNWS